MSQKTKLLTEVVGHLNDARTIAPRLGGDEHRVGGQANGFTGDGIRGHDHRGKALRALIHESWDVLHGVSRWVKLTFLGWMDGGGWERWEGQTIVDVWWREGEAGVD